MNQRRTVVYYFLGRYFNKPHPKGYFRENVVDCRSGGAGEIPRGRGSKIDAPRSDIARNAVDVASRSGREPSISNTRIPTRGYCWQTPGRRWSGLFFADRLRLMEDRAKLANP